MKLFSRTADDQRSSFVSSKPEDANADSYNAAMPSGVYESTVVVMNDGRRSAAAARSNVCAKYGAPALAVCGIAVGIVALTLVAVGATRGNANNYENSGGTLSRSAASGSGHATANFTAEGRMAGPSERSEDDIKWEGRDAEPTNDERTADVGARINAGDANGSGGGTKNLGGASTFIGLGVALLVAAAVVILYAFHSRGHNVLAPFSRGGSGRSSSSGSGNATPGKSSGTTTGPSLVKKLSAITVRATHAGNEHDPMSTPMTGTIQAGGNDRLRDARDSDEVRRLVENSGTDGEANKQEPLITVIS